jgi:ABC-type transport system involved in Fe-S cluster assembly fused permease/ATPase subunit
LDETTGERKLQIDKLQLIARTSTSFVIAHRRATLRPGTQTEPIKG